jgi:hypothetical protein
MEMINTILGIVASALGIIATCISWKTKKDVESIIKNNNNSQIIGNNSSNNEQHIGDRG